MPWPVIRNDTGAAQVGRALTTNGFSMWLSGGGIQRGITIGETDEFGQLAIENLVNHDDYRATLSHLFELESENFVFK